MKQESKPDFGWSVDENGHVVGNGGQEDMVKWLTQDLTSRLLSEYKK